jgi:hypothetical protein
MKRRQGLGFAGISAIVSLSMFGCTSTGSVQDQAIGTGIGAAIGCGVGTLITGDARGCAAGAAVGALVGFGTVTISQYNARQVRTAKADKRVYGISTSPKSPQVKIRKGTSAPKTVKPGEEVNIATDYSVMLPKGVADTSVTESWSLKKDGKTITQLPQKAAQRTAGGWQADATISIPGRVSAGTYVIEHRVQSGGSYDTDESIFVVEG